MNVGVVSKIVLGFISLEVNEFLGFLKAYEMGLDSTDKVVEVSNFARCGSTVPRDSTDILIREDGYFLCWSRKWVFEG